MPVNPEFVITRAWEEIVRVRFFVTETGVAAESVTVTTTENGPLTVGVPEIAPVVALIVKPAGKPVADQL